MPVIIVALPATMMDADRGKMFYCNPLPPARVALYIIYLMYTHCIFLILNITPLPFYSNSYLTFILSYIQPLYIYVFFLKI